MEEKQYSKEALDIMDVIRQEVTESDVTAMIDDEVPEWLDSDWEEDGYDDEYSWYMDHSNGEAEGMVLTNILTEYQQKHGNMAPSVYAEVRELVKEEFETFLGKA